MNLSPVIRRRAKTWTEPPSPMHVLSRSTPGAASTGAARSNLLQSFSPGDYASPQRWYGSSAKGYSPWYAPPPFRRDYRGGAMATTNHATNGGGGDVGEKQDMLQWINSALMRGSQEPVTNVEAAMADGITLARLARVLVGEEPPRHILNPSMLVQRVENLQVCLAWLHERGVPIPNIHVEDLASGNAQTGLALCKALHTYDMSRTAPVGNPAPGKHLVQAQSAHSTTYPTNLDKDDVAILGWLGSVVEEDITSYQALSDGHILCKLFRRMAPGCLDEDLSKKGTQERLDYALAAAEANLSISRGLLDTKKLAQRREENYKIFSFLQRCQITYKQLRRQEFMRLEKERSPSSRLSPSSPLASPGVEGCSAFGFVEQHESTRMSHTERALATVKSSPTATTEPSRNGEHIAQWANRAQKSQAVGSEGRVQSPSFTTAKTSTPTTSSGRFNSESSTSRSLGGPKVYSPPHQPTPPPTPPTSAKESGGQVVSVLQNPLVGQHHAGNENGMVTSPDQDLAAGNREVGNGSMHHLPSQPNQPPPTGGHPTHQGNLSNGKTDSGTATASLSILHQPLQSSSNPQLVQSEFLSRLELMEQELTDVRERLDTERDQFLQKLQEIAVEEEKKRREMEKEFKKLAEVARQLSQHYDTCFVTLARKIAHVQDRMGMESEDTISAFVGDANPEEGRPVDTKQLFQEISSLKDQIQTIVTGPADALPSEPGSKEPEEEPREGSGSSPPSSMPATPDLMAAPDINVQATEGLQKKLFVRKGKKQEKKKEKPKSTISPSPSSSSLVELAHSANITHANHKKLSKFFGEDLPKVENLKTFLAGLGFPELLPKFTKEQVTLNELQLMTEQHLVELGIPMGPRLAILSEIQSLESVCFED